MVNIVTTHDLTRAEETDLLLKFGTEAVNSYKNLKEIDLGLTNVRTVIHTYIFNQRNQTV